MGSALSFPSLTVPRKRLVCAFDRSCAYLGRFVCFDHDRERCCDAFYRSHGLHRGRMLSWFLKLFAGVHVQVHIMSACMHVTPMFFSSIECRANYTNWTKHS